MRSIVRGLVLVAGMFLAGGLTGPVAMAQGFGAQVPPSSGAANFANPRPGFATTPRNAFGTSPRPTHRHHRHHHRHHRHRGVSRSGFRP